MTYDDVLSAAIKMPATEKVRLLEDVSAALRRELRSSQPKSRKSLYGAFADLGSAPSMEEIDDARREAWANFPREDI